MADVTPNYSLPYPELTDPADISAAVQPLAEQLDGTTLDLFVAKSKVAMGTVDSSAVVESDALPAYLTDATVDLAPDVDSHVLIVARFDLVIRHLEGPTSQLTAECHIYLDGVEVQAVDYHHAPGADDDNLRLSFSTSKVLALPAGAHTIALHARDVSTTPGLGNADDYTLGGSFSYLMLPV